MDKTSSISLKKWEEEEDKRQQFYQKIKIDHHELEVVKVKVTHGHDISKSIFRDLFSNPHAGVILSCVQAIDGKTMRTQVIECKDAAVEWNETFIFVIGKAEPHQRKATENITIEATLVDRTAYSKLVVLGRKSMDLSGIGLKKTKTLQVNFDGKGVVGFEITREIKAPDIRLSASLSDAELKFRKKRVKETMAGFQNFFGDSTLFAKGERIPTVSMVCSGGGIRAATALAGAMEVLQKSHLLDCLMYAIGLSGSAWYLSSAYAHQSLTDDGKLAVLHEFLQKSFESNPVMQILPLLSKYGKERQRKLDYGQPVTLVDFYGLLVGNIFLGDELIEYVLSDMRSFVETAQVPFPLFAVEHVKQDVAAEKYHADVYLNPYEVEVPNYGVNIDIKQLGTEFTCCIANYECPELRLHFLQGAIGSFFAIRFGYLLGFDEDDSTLLPVARAIASRMDMESVPESEIFVEEDIECFTAKERDDLRLRFNKNHREATEAGYMQPIAQDVSARTLQGEQEEEVIQYDPRELERDGFENLSNLSELQSEIFPMSENSSLDDEPDSLYGPISEMSDISAHTGAPYALGTTMLKKLLRKLPIFTDRKFLVDRGAEVLNFVRDFPEVKHIRQNPTDQTEYTGETISITDYEFSLVDAGLLCNVPMDAALMPQRHSDVILVMDFNEYKSVDKMDYEPLLIAQQLAKQEGTKFPPINAEELRNNPKEVRVFEDKDDPECPIVVWFSLCNTEFSKLENYKPKHDVKVPKEEAFNHFEVFDKFRTFRSHYDKLDFYRLHELAQHNVERGLEEVKAAIKRKMIQEKKQKD